MSKSDIGVYGMGVMGSNLALNLESHGNRVSVYNRTVKGDENLLAEFMKKHGAGKSFHPAGKVKDFVQSLKSPRIILIMIKSGDPVDQVISELQPLLNDGDIIVDGGNSYFEETERRATALRFKKINYAGVGISGGAEGARNGPSIMAGTTKKCWKYLGKFLEPIAAKSFDDTPCCALIGSGGAGHFIKMVHNGIEYADMQILAESYDIMRKLLNMKPQEISDIFYSWNSTAMGSYLLEISAEILEIPDDSGAGSLVDQILDSAGQKGTGSLTVQTAAAAGVQTPVISSAVYLRSISSLIGLRRRLSASLEAPDTSVLPSSLHNRKSILKNLEDAFLASRMVAAAEGFYLITEAAEHYKWRIDPAEVARIWQGGCIIRSELLRNIVAAYEQGSNLSHLFLSPIYANRFRKLQDGWRETIILCTGYGLPIPAMSSALIEYDSLRTEKLPTNLIQAQRDYFGSHMYEKIDEPRGTFFHTDWEKTLEQVRGGSDELMI